MGPVSLGVKPTVDSYGEIISSGEAAAFYDFVRGTAGNGGPLQQAAGTAAEDFKTEIIHIIESTHHKEVQPARPSPDQTFASVQGGATPATAKAPSQGS